MFVGDTRNIDVTLGFIWENRIKKFFLFPPFCTYWIILYLVLVNIIFILKIIKHRQMKGVLDYLKH